MPSGTVLTIDDENGQVSVKDKGGETSLPMDMKNGEVTLGRKNQADAFGGEDLCRDRKRRQHQPKKGTARSL